MNSYTLGPIHIERNEGECENLPQIKCRSFSPSFNVNKPLTLDRDLVLLCYFIIIIFHIIELISLAFGSSF